MKAFISYSHKDSQMLERLHAHLSTLSREGQLTSWTDEKIPAGGQLNSSISRELESSQLFIALLSPDYLASNYCYEREFMRALGMNKQGDLLIVPIVVEPCDWLSTPFKEFKALPQDGKAISTWENSNTAFLNVNQSLRKLTEFSPPEKIAENVGQYTFSNTTRNYRVKKDFDTIEKIEFKEKSFLELVDLLKKYCAEISTLDNIKIRTLKDFPTEFQCLLVNRNKIATECQLNLSIGEQSPGRNGFQYSRADIAFSFNQSQNSNPQGFALSLDEYHLFWAASNLHFGNTDPKELSVREMADSIWKEWLESVGIHM